jgi:hypothetical protein
MNAFRIVVPLAIVVLLVTAGAAGRAQADGACAPTNVVFYSGDTGNLATALHANSSECTDYWISITPTAAGEPRDGAPLQTIHGFGQHFHALAELRPEQWRNYADGWYAAGVKLHDDMLAVGYDPTRDTWAVNEAGFPSTSTTATDVFFGNDTARQNFQDFVRGLFTGSSGPVMPGLVFASDPAQYTTDIWPYEQGLAKWYADTGFWQDMKRYVRFWAQETYADARSWGVAGASSDVRASHLNDYFLHGLRLAASGGGASAAARAFFADAYTPVGNGTYRYPAPDPTTGGPGFGLTDIPIDSMLNFISTQTYALRTSAPTQFGFAISAKNSSPTWNGQIYTRLAGTIHDSEGGAAGACTTGCDGTLDSAAFTDTWRSFATPPLITAHVDGVLGDNGWYTSDVMVSWTVSDSETPIWSSAGCDPTTLTADTAARSLTCTAVSSGGTNSTSITVKRDATAPALVVSPTPATIWPPDNKLVPVKVNVSVVDAMSGPSGWKLIDAPSDFVQFGALRAVKDAAYTLTYAARDMAGNVATRTTTVVVPHDQGLHRGGATPD